MRIEANVLVDELLSNLLKDNNIDRAEVTFSVCQLLKTLGLAKRNMTENTKNLKEVDFCFYHTEALKKILRNSQVSEVDGNNDNSDDENNNDNNDNNDDNNNEDEERVRRSKSARKR